MDIRKIKKLIELLHDTDVAEIEISEGEESVRITRGSTNQVVVQSPQLNAPQPMVTTYGSRVSILRLIRTRQRPSCTWCA